MSAQPNVPILRVWVAPGHGFSNKTPGVDDPGAVSCYGVEAQIAASVADGLIAAIDSDDSLSLMAEPTPICDSDGECLRAKHPGRSHLGYSVEWINHHAAPFDLLTSIHLNDAEDASVSGVEVYYSKLTPQHQKHALKIGQAIANYIGIPFRGAFPSDKSQHTTLAIVDHTKPEAYLIEIGFVSNGKDVAAVKQCGAGAIIEGIKARRSEK